MMNTKKKTSVIRVPLWYGCNKRGVERAPEILAQALQNNMSDISIIDIPIPELPQNETDTLHAKHVQTIASITKQLAQVVSAQLAEGRFVLTIGGDHSLGLGTVAGSLQHDENIGLIWFDAHGDINTEAGSPTGNVHGMPIAALMGLCQSELKDVSSHLLNPKHVFWIGARSLDKGEKELIERLNLHVYSSDYIREKGMKAVMDEVKEEMHQAGIHHTHLSFDVDALDPKVFPATGVREPNGLLMEDFEVFAKQLPSLPSVIAMDFVEYNPLLENTEGHCEELCNYMLKNLLSAVENKQ